MPLNAFGQVTLTTSALRTSFPYKPLRILHQAEIQNMSVLASADSENAYLPAGAGRNGAQASATMMDGHLKSTVGQ